MSLNAEALEDGKLPISVDDLMTLTVPVLQFQMTMYENSRRRYSSMALAALNFVIQEMDAKIQSFLADQMASGPVTHSKLIRIHEMMVGLQVMMFQTLFIKLPDRFDLDEIYAIAQDLKSQHFEVWTDVLDWNRIATFAQNLAQEETTKPETYAPSDFI